MSLNQVEKAVDYLLNAGITSDKHEGHLAKEVVYYTPKLSKEIGIDFSTKDYPILTPVNTNVTTSHVRCELFWKHNNSSYTRAFKLLINNKVSMFELPYELLHECKVAGGYPTLEYIKQELYYDLAKNHPEYLTKNQKVVFKPSTAYSSTISPPSDESDVVTELLKVCPGLENILNEKCPDDNCYSRPIGSNSRLTDWVIHLNDRHGWARSPSEAKEGQRNIADWLDEVALLKGWDLSLKLPDTEAKSPTQEQIDFAERVKKKKEFFAQLYGIPKPLYPNNEEKYKAALLDHEKLVGQTLYANVPKLDPQTAHMEHTQKELDKALESKMKIIKEFYLKGFEQ